PVMKMYLVLIARLPRWFVYMQKSGTRGATPRSALQVVQSVGGEGSAAGAESVSCRARGSTTNASNISRSSSHGRDDFTRKLGPPAFQPAGPPTFSRRFRDPGRLKAGVPAD